MLPRRGSHAMSVRRPGGFGFGFGFGDERTAHVADAQDDRVIVGGCDRNRPRRECDCPLILLGDNYSGVPGWLALAAMVAAAGQHVDTTRETLLRATVVLRQVEEYRG